LGPYGLPRPNLVLLYACDVLNPNNGVSGDPRNIFKMTPDPGEPDYKRDKAVAGFETPVGTVLKIGDRGPLMSNSPFDGLLFQHSHDVLDRLKTGTFLQEAVDQANTVFPPRAPLPTGPISAPLNIPQIDMKLAPASGPFDPNTRMKWVYLANQTEVSDMTSQQGNINNWWYRTEWSNN